MKMRYGFVSNSSSSSFIAIGFKIPYIGEELKDFYRLNFGSEDELDNAIEEKTGLEYFPADEERSQDIIGIRLGHFDEAERVYLSIDDYYDRLAAYREEFNLDVPILIFCEEIV